MPTIRRLLVLLTVVAAAMGQTVPARAQSLPEDPRLGLVYNGLRTSAMDSLCHGAFEAYIDASVSPLMKSFLCTHGPDPAPEGIDVRQNREPDFAAAVPLPSGATAQAVAPTVPCYGNGNDGFRVQLLYAHSASGADRYAEYSSSFRTWAGRLDQVVDDSAAETGGSRHVRLVTDAGCNPAVDRVTLSPGAMSDFATMVSELHAQGYARTDRKYLVWADSNTYCGISEIYTDDSADPTPGRNYNNANPWIQGSIGRVDNGCWGLSQLVEAHEFIHLIGGVQPTAPNATAGFHCNDESDRLCYADGTKGAVMRQVCPTSHETLYDCRHDDYFSTAPTPGSYLATHWNTANSAFLTAQAPVGSVTTTTAPPPPPTTPTTIAPPPTTPTTVAPTSTSVPPSTTTTSTTLGPPATTTTSTTTAPPTTTGPPSAPQSLTASQPAVGSGVQLAWRSPAIGPVTGYRIYRGTSPWVQTILATVGNVAGYNDASAGRSLYYYRVTAINAAGESASSNLTGMIGKALTPGGGVREDLDRRLTVSNLQRTWLATRRWA